MSAYAHQMERQYSAGSLSSGSEMGSRYIVESGFYMTSFAATIFITGLVTAGVLLITLLVSLAVMLQSCQSKHAGVIELQSMNDYYSYCKICAMHAELNNLQGYNLPKVCRAPAIRYVKGGQYAADLDSTMSLIEDHFSLVKPSDDVFGVVLIEIDDLFSSYPHSSGWLHRFNNYGVSECMKEARNSKLKLVLRLYMNLKSAGWPIILLSREPGTQRNVTTCHLISAGFRGWSSLMMREDYEDSIRGNEYIIRKRNVIEGKGFHIKSIISHLMDAVMVQDPGMRNFKLPSPLCDEFEHQMEIPVAPY
ncbi:uncharacterized protein At2g39920 [Neltuma alba]|uniref:uncharacterized protein At2g39920 n=1 Tax=Neltuma alba TaxID=207710 RepID=UPI0010A41B9A|nr:uncharacterized protein At2g39920 [Prosopis alba]XP_028792677.1 uncharacterized protein At2g39920 [Prosopis alba]XP_028792678.1 uncharacterized protein At2g39920 [Prosopis alba]